MANGDGAPKGCMLGVDNKRRIATLEKSDEHVWKAIDELRERMDRLPAWGVALVSVLSATAGGGIATAITLALQLVK